MEWCSIRLDKACDLRSRFVLFVIAHGHAFLGVTDASEQVGDLVRIHARSRHLDRASPVEVIVAQVECHPLNLELGQSRLVQGYEEVRGTHAALSAPDRHKEEVELFLGVLGFLDEVFVDDAAAGRVAETILAV